MVPTLISGTLEIQVSEDNTNFFTVKNAALTAVLTTGATTGGFAWDSEETRRLRGYKWIKFVSGASQTTTARVFTVVLKDDDR